MSENRDVESAFKDKKGEDKNKSAMVYSVDDVPPWHWSIILGFQVNSNLISCIPMDSAILREIVYERLIKGSFLRGSITKINADLGLVRNSLRYFGVLSEIGLRHRLKADNNVDVEMWESDGL